MLFPRWPSSSPGLGGPDSPGPARGGALTGRRASPSQAEKAKALTVLTAGFGYRLAKGQELPLTLKASIALYAAAKIGALCSVLTLLYTTVVVAFAVPKLYDMNKEKIDEHVAKVSAKGKELLIEGRKVLNEKVLSKLKVPEDVAKKTE